MTDIFISYKSEDRARVKPLVDALVAEGLTVWWDVHIEGGAAWRESIRSNLDAAACVIVVWSEASVGPAGYFVQDEAARAERRGVFLPVAIDEVEPPLGFGQDQALKLVDWRGGRRDPYFMDVLATARAIVAGGPRPRPMAPARSAARRRRPWPATLTIVAGLLAVMAGAAWFGAPAPLCRSIGLSCGSGARVADNSIAVLPFANFSGDPSQDYFSDGLSEELINALTRLETIKVVGRTSAFTFKGTRESSAQIGARLGVAYLLDGSVRRQGQTVRVSADLVEADTGVEKWAQTYDRPMRDIFQIQGDIAGLVADALRVRIVKGAGAASSAGGTTNPVALDAYLRARAIQNKAGDEASFRAALTEIGAALAADPNYAMAHAMRARLMLFIADTFAEGDAVRALSEEGLAEARRAVALAPDLALAQSTLGAANAQRLNIAEARIPFENSLRLGPGDASILQSYGSFESAIGRGDLGLPALKRAAALDPLNASVARYLGIGYYLSRRYPETMVAMRAALALRPGMPLAHSYLGASLIETKDLAGARAEFQREPLDWARQTGLAVVALRRGDRPAADIALAALRKPGDDGTFYQQAEVLAQSGDLDGAVAALDHAYAARDAGLLQAPADPLLDPLRGRPGFQKLLHRLGMV